MIGNPANAQNPSIQPTGEHEVVIEQSKADAVGCVYGKKRNAVDTPKSKHTKENARGKRRHLCQTPPTMIVSTHGNKCFKRGPCIGYGGFARCFQIEDSVSKQVYAAKTFSKIALCSRKQKDSVFAEISIHKKLRHANIVEFIDCFEDDFNIYIIMEMCCNKSLWELVRSRKVLTEPEVRFFLVQIIGAVKHMHSLGVVHRDLKLANIFLDSGMNIKVGDFGLAALILSESDRKKSVCGTPNYIAPEILLESDQGHSYEVDIWSIGIIMYIMLIGRPPFQSKTIEITYQRITKSDYKIPLKADISREAQHLIKVLLTPDPNARPSVSNILKHPFFMGSFPEALDSNIMATVPKNILNLNMRVSYDNFISCIKNSKPIKCKLVATERHGNVDRDKNIDETMKQSKSWDCMASSGLPLKTRKEDHDGVALDTVKNGPYNTVSPITKSFGKKKHASMNKVEDLQPDYRNIGEYLVGTKEKSFAQDRSHKDVFFRKLVTSANEQSVIHVAYPRIPYLYDVFENVLDTISRLLKKATPEYQISLESRSRPQIVYVTKWINDPDKYGIGYELSDGTTGAVRPKEFAVHMNKYSNTVDVIEEDEKLNCMTVRRIWSGKNTKFSKPDWDKLTQVLLLQKYMETYLQQSGDVKSECIESGIGCKPHGKYGEDGFQIENKSDNVLYLVQFIELTGVNLLHLSNGDCQANFEDHTKLLFKVNGDGIAIINNDSIHHVRIKSGYVCCSQLHEQLIRNNILLKFIRHKTLICRNQLNENKRS